jgi:hypothetical protein
MIFMEIDILVAECLSQYGLTEVPVDHLSTCALKAGIIGMLA